MSCNTLFCLGWFFFLQEEIGRLRTCVVELESELREPRRGRDGGDTGGSLLSELTNQLNAVRAER